MTNLTPELIAKAKTAKTAEELQALAKENGLEMTAEEAEAYFAQLHPVSGEMNDDELENVSGGGCHKDNRLVVTAFKLCSNWECKKCYNAHYKNRRLIYDAMYDYDKSTWMHTCTELAGGGKYMANCTNCRLCSYEGGLWLCNDPYRT